MGILQKLLRVGNTDKESQIPKNSSQARAKAKETNYSMYDYSTDEKRVAICETLQQYAKTGKEKWERKWQEYDSYYRGHHTAAEELTRKFYSDNGGAGLSFEPAYCEEPYIQVESQLTPDVPDFQYYGRDDDKDNEKAKQREYVVKFIMDNNRIKDMMMRNGRRNNIFGNAFFKVYWDSSIRVAGCKHRGDIKIKDIDPSCIFPDPDCDVFQDGQFCNYEYYMHLNAARQMFAQELIDKKISVEALISRSVDTDIYVDEQSAPRSYSINVKEHWFKQPFSGTAKMHWVDDEDVVHDTVSFEAGDIACVIVVNGYCLKYIPKYWVNTAEQNLLFPFVHYVKICDTKSMWGISEMAHIIPSVDAIDREQAFAQINRAFMANDIVIVEEDSLVDGSEISNVPAAIINVQAGKVNSIRRMGGINTAPDSNQNCDYFRGEIERICANYDSSRGKEPSRVTTSSGIAMLNERADSQRNTKETDALNGFERLVELIDWTALEFYNSDRLIYIGVNNKDGGKPLEPVSAAVANPMKNLNPKQGNVFFTFNSNTMRRQMCEATYEVEMGEDGLAKLDQYGNPTKIQTEDSAFYYPRVDVVVKASGGSRKSVAYALSALEQLSLRPVTADNYEIIICMLEILEIPQAAKLIKQLENRFGQLQSPLSDGTAVGAAGESIQAAQGSKPSAPSGELAAGSDPASAQQLGVHSQVSR